MGVTFGGKSCLDPITLHDFCREHGLPVSSWFGKANSFKCPLGSKPGIGYLLMRLGDLGLSVETDDTVTGDTELDLDQPHDLVFTVTFEQQSITLKNLIVARAEAVCPGLSGDSETHYLVELADRRLTIRRVPINAAYNVRSATTPTTSYTATMNAGVAWTWATMGQNLWETVGTTHLGSWPGLPFTPDGTPDSFIYYQMSALDALQNFLARVGCSLRYNPVADTFSIVRLGVADTVFDTAETKWFGQRVWDNYNLDLNRALTPQYCRVAFHKFTQPVDASPWYLVDVADVTAPIAPVADIQTGTYVVVPDDLWAVYDAAGTQTAASLAATAARATERAADYFRILKLGKDELVRVYAGIISEAGFLPGAQVLGTAWEDRGLGAKTALYRGFVPASLGLYDTGCCDYGLGSRVRDGGGRTGSEQQAAAISDLPGIPYAWLGRSNAGGVPPASSESVTLTSVYAATTGNIDIANPPATIDGAAPPVGDLVLVWNQTTTAENWPYVYNGAGVPLTPWATTSLPYGSQVYIAAGTTYGADIWSLDNDAAYSTDPFAAADFDLTGGDRVLLQDGSRALTASAWSWTSALALTTTDVTWTDSSILRLTGNLLLALGSSGDITLLSGTDGGGNVVIGSFLSGSVTLNAGPGFTGSVEINAGTAINLNHAIKFTGDISPAQITADQTDYNPTGLATASVLRLDTDASRTINSLAGGADGRILIIHNIGANPIILLDDDDVTGSAAMRFQFNASVTLSANESVFLQYDATSQRWRGGKMISASITSAGGWTDDGTVVRLTTVTDQVGIGTALPTSKLTVAGTFSVGDIGSGVALGNSHILLSEQSESAVVAAANSVWNGVNIAPIAFAAVILTGASTTIATVTGFNYVTIQQPSIEAGSFNQTITHSATLYIAGPPLGVVDVASVTISNPYSLWVDAGNMRLDGNLLLPTSGTVIDWNSGDMTLTHSANTLTLAGGVLNLPAGSVSAPSLILNSDVNTGFYGTADSIAVSAGGIQVARFYQIAAVGAVNFPVAVDMDNTLNVDGVATFNANIVGVTITGSIIATQAEQETGTAVNKIVTPGRQQFHPSASKAWGELDGTGLISLRASFNQDAPTDNGVGDYTFNHTTNFSSTSYCVGVGNLYDSASAASHIHSRYNATAKAAGSCRMLSIIRGTGAPVDSDEYFASFHGDQ